MKKPLSSKKLLAISNAKYKATVVTESGYNEYANESLDELLLSIETNEGIVIDTFDAIFLTLRAGYTKQGSANISIKYLA